MTNSKKNLRSRNFGGMYNVAVIGATGNVGRKILDYLHERKFSVNNISAFASYKSVGKQVHFGDDNLIAVSRNGCSEHRAHAKSRSPRRKSEVNKSNSCFIFLATRAIGAMKKLVRKCW